MFSIGDVGDILVFKAGGRWLMSTGGCMQDMFWLFVAVNG